jgi:hypothetical protein
METVFLIQMKFVHENYPRTLFVCKTREIAERMMSRMSQEPGYFDIYIDEFRLETYD